MLPPENIPALPRPEMARPTIKAADVGAEALIADPIANMRYDTMKTIFIENIVYNFPNVSSVDVDAIIL